MNLQARVSPQYWSGRAGDAYGRWQSAPGDDTGPLTWPLVARILLVLNRMEGHGDAPEAG